MRFFFCWNLINKYNDCYSFEVTINQCDHTSAPLQLRIMLFKINHFRIIQCLFQVAGSDKKKANLRRPRIQLSYLVQSLDNIGCRVSTNPSSLTQCPDFIIPCKYSSTELEFSVLNADNLCISAWLSGVGSPSLKWRVSSNSNQVLKYFVGSYLTIKPLRSLKIY